MKAFHFFCVHQKEQRGIFFLFSLVSSLSRVCVAFVGSEKSVLLLRTKAEIFDGNPAVPLFVVFVCMCVCVFAFDMCRKKKERIYPETYPGSSILHKFKMLGRRVRDWVCLQTTVPWHSSGTGNQACKQHVGSQQFACEQSRTRIWSDGCLWSPLRHAHLLETLHFQHCRVWYVSSAIQNQKVWAFS